MITSVNPEALREAGARLAARTLDSRAIRWERRNIDPNRTIAPVPTLVRLLHDVVMSLSKGSR